MEALVTTVITILSPYVSAGAKKAAEIVGESIAGQAGKLMARLRDWFTGDQEAEAALDSFEKNPNRYGGVLQELLGEKIKANPHIGEELAQLVNNLGPRVDVLQKIEQLAGQAVGLDLAKWEAGLAVVRQDVTRVEPGAILKGAVIRP